MPEDFTVTKVKFAGEKPNPHGGTLYKFYCSLYPTAGESDGNETHDVYWQRKSRELEEGETFYGHIEQGEYGPRFKTDQRPDGAGNFQRPAYKVEKSKDDYWDAKDARIEWAWACNLAAQELVAPVDHEEVVERARIIRAQARVELGKVDADVGSGQAAHGASEPRPPVAEDAVDLSAEADVGGGPGGGAAPAAATTTPSHPAADVSPEASRAQKGKLTQMFHAAGLSREAMKAVVLFRCGSEKATKAGASQLITDLQEGATHDALLAEIWDAKRAGNPLGARAAALIPTEVPMDTEGLPGDDGSLPEVPAKDESVPF